MPPDASKLITPQCSFLLRADGHVHQRVFIRLDGRRALFVHPVQPVRLWESQNNARQRHDPDPNPSLSADCLTVVAMAAKFFCLRRGKMDSECKGKASKGLQSAAVRRVA